jgi:hypothetical protein
MTQRDNILQELNELESFLSSYSASMPYTAPANYFDGLSEQIMRRIKALEAATPQEELEILSPFLASLHKTTPYRVNPGYFDELADKLRFTVEEESAGSEIETLSPLLSGLKKQVPYSVPAGYFDQLATGKPQERQNRGKLVSLTSHKWFRYAAAAVVTGMIAVGALLFLNRDSLSVESPEWVEKSVKKVSTDELDKFIEMTDADAQALAANTPSAEVSELARNISDEEMQDFLKDVQVIETGSEDELLLN